MGIFTLLLGGGYLGVKYLSERSKDKEYERRDAERDLKYNKLKETIVWTSEVYHGTLKYVREGKHAEEIYEILEDDLKSVFGENYRSYFILPGADYSKITHRVTEEDQFSVYSGINDGGTSYRSSAYWAEQLLMSKKGYADIFSYSLGCNKYVEPNKEFCKIILNDLKRAGVERRLGFNIFLKGDGRKFMGSTRISFVGDY